ncbi:MAG: cysteine--tRNA ligase [Chloroflexi bacterium]|nr:cysteine--tRNA ligase [Chloroflexota bacterium]
MKLYDTLTGEKREFAPLGVEVKVYVCGITPYAPTHVGHAMSYMAFDVLRRYLEFRGYRLRHVQNFTDVDDKIIRAATSQGVATPQLADRYIEEFLEDMDALNILRAHVYPRVTQEVPRILEMIQALVEKGYAYHANGDVYFRVGRVSRYGELAHRTLDSMIAGARVEPGEGKEHPMDFALWKAAKAGEPAWGSPWGDGRPGWHIECSAMAYHYLGPTLDIHGGGQDLIFPHHENEIAQTEAFTGARPFVRFWLHNGLLRLGEEKMSKSLGNLVTVREALARYSAEALRLYFLSSHYRSPLSYTDEGVASQERALERLRAALTPQDGSPSAAALDPDPYRQRFLAAMDDDLNTPQAIAVLFDLARAINRSREEGADVHRAQNTLRELGAVLGHSFTVAQPRDVDSSPFIELLIEIRGELRRHKQYELADRLRDRLGSLGIVLEDTPRGTIWKRERAAS